MFFKRYFAGKFELLLVFTRNDDSSLRHVDNNPLFCRFFFVRARMPFSEVLFIALLSFLFLFRFHILTLPLFLLTFYGYKIVTCRTWRSAMVDAITPWPRIICTALWSNLPSTYSIGSFRTGARSQERDDLYTASRKSWFSPGHLFLQEGLADHYRLQYYLRCCKPLCIPQDAVHLYIFRSSCIGDLASYIASLISVKIRTCRIKLEAIIWIAQSEKFVYLSSSFVAISSPIRT